MQIRPARILVLLLIAVALPLGACGKKGKPQPPSKVEAQDRKDDKKEATE